MREQKAKPKRTKYITVWRPAARDQLRKIDRPTAVTILRKLAELETDPYAFGTIELVSRPGVRRLRVGRYRVFYMVDKGELTIVVVTVDHRSDVYDRH